MYSFTSPDMGGMRIPIGTKLIYTGCEPDNAPKREGWYWYNFVSVDEAIED